MKSNMNLTLPVLTLLLLTAAVTAGAAVRYVVADNPTAAPPYTNWAGAAASIQAAVDESAADDEVVVTNGLYAIGGKAVYGTMTNRVAVDKPVTVRSVNGPGVTTTRSVTISPATDNWFYRLSKPL
jgi:hypothetical protein